MVGFRAFPYVAIGMIPSSAVMLTMLSVFKPITTFFVFSPVPHPVDFASKRLSRLPSSVHSWKVDFVVPLVLASCHALYLSP